MHIGLLTARFSKETPFKEIAEWASKAGFAALEVRSGPGGHLTADHVLRDDGREVKKILNGTGLRISSLAYYSVFNQGGGPEAYSRNMKDILAMAQALSVGVVCTVIGFPAAGKTRIKTICEDAPSIFHPLAADAEARGIKIAFENWYATNLQHLECFKAVTEVFPEPAIGFNFDPSHLVWQGIDYLAAVGEFKDRIYHTHAKDTAVMESVRRRVGVMESGWWRYVIPGYGVVSWGEYIHALRLAGYNGVLSIEHEDRAFDAKEGFEKGLRFLSALI